MATHDDLLADKNQELQALKEILDECEALEEKQAALRAEILELVPEKPSADGPPPPVLTGEQVERKDSLQQQLRDTFAQERELNERKHAAWEAVEAAEEALDAFLEQEEGSEQWHEEQQRRQDALDAIRAAFGMKPFPEGMPMQHRKTALITFLDVSHNTNLPLYLKNGRLRERQNLGYDNVILEDTELLLEDDPIAALQALGTIEEITDVPEANKILYQLKEAWEAYEDANQD